MSFPAACNQRRTTPVSGSGAVPGPCKSFRASCPGDLQGIDLDGRRGAAATARATSTTPDRASCCRARRPVKVVALPGGERWVHPFEPRCAQAGRSPLLRAAASTSSPAASAASACRSPSTSRDPRHAPPSSSSAAARSPTNHVVCGTGRALHRRGCARQARRGVALEGARRRRHPRQRRRHRGRADGRCRSIGRARLATITGVVHAAGILVDALIALRTPHPTSPVIDVKARAS